MLLLPMISGQESILWEISLYQTPVSSLTD